jgi:signal transduction histidine kinase
MRFARSLSLRILVASFGALFLSLLASAAVFVMVSRPMEARGPRRFPILSPDEAAALYEHEGPQALSRQLNRLNERFGGMHYLTDAAGRDVTDGTNRSDLLGTDGRPRRRAGDRFVVVHPSGDGRYRLLFVGIAPEGPGTFLRYAVVLVLAIAALLYWWLSRSITSPLGALSAAVERFGRGELDVRAPGRRRGDEIGDLGRAFDVMAVRIQTLLAAERRLLQDISHELRSPLARLTVAIDVLRTSPDPERATKQIELDAARLTALVDSLVAATREEGDPSTMAAEPVDLWSILVGVGDSCAIEADARGCRLALSASGGGGRLRGSPELLRRAFENVVRNAIRYAPEGSTVEVEMRGNRHQAIVTVRDYGPGVPAEDAAHLGTPFFRVETARDAKTGGIGLGLAIARRAVLAHRGALVVENAEPGLRIAIELPVEQLDARGVARLPHTPGTRREREGRRGAGRLRA